MPDPVHELAIIGAGPIGLELAAALKRLGIDYAHFDARQIGHTMSWWAPETRFFSSNERIAIAGVPLLTPDQGKATREQYLTYLRTVAGAFDLRVRTYEPVTRVAQDADGTFTLTSLPAGGERTTRARRVVLAVGGTDRPRLIDVPGESLPHVSHYLADPHTYFRQRVVVVGGKNSAIEAALRCHHAGAHVALVHREPAIVEKEIKYWLVPETRGLIESGRLPAHFGASLTRITPTHVELTTGRRLDADFVLLMTGYVQDNALLTAAGVPLDGPGLAPVYDPATMQTPVAGLYVAGTAVGGTQGRYKVFIENCHGHVEKIVRHAFGREASVNRVVAGLPES